MRTIATARWHDRNPSAGSGRSIATAAEDCHMRGLESTKIAVNSPCPILSVAGPAVKREYGHGLPSAYYAESAARVRARDSG